MFRSVVRREKHEKKQLTAQPRSVGNFWRKDDMWNANDHLPNTFPVKTSNVPHSVSEARLFLVLHMSLIEQNELCQPCTNNLIFKRKMQLHSVGHTSNHSTYEPVSSRVNMISFSYDLSPLRACVSCLEEYRRSHEKYILRIMRIELRTLHMLGVFSTAKLCPLPWK